MHASEPTCDSTLYSSETCLLLATTVALWIPVLRTKARRAAYTRTASTRALCGYDRLNLLIVELIRKLEIDHSRIVLLQSAALILKPVAKAGGCRINLRGHPAATREEVLLFFHCSFKQGTIRTEEVPHAALQLTLQQYSSLPDAWDLVYKYALQLTLQQHSSSLYLMPGTRYLVPKYVLCKLDRLNG